MGFRSLLGIIFMLVYTYYAPHLNAMKTYKTCLCMKPFIYAMLPVLNVLARASDKGGGEREAGGGAVGWLFNAVMLVYFVVWSTTTLVWREWLSFPLLSLLSILILSNSKHKPNHHRRIPDTRDAPHRHGTYPLLPSL